MLSEVHETQRWIETAQQYSKCGKKRLEAMGIACLFCNARNIPGVIVECGVWQGGNIMIARWAAPSRVCWLYDTFNGMTEPGPFDTKRKGKKLHKNWIGKHAVSVQEVRDNMIAHNLYDANKFRFIIGDVRKTLLDDNNLPEKIAVLRLDTDFYDSTKIEMEKLYPRLVVGGLLIIDDYGHWLGARKAVIDYLGASNKLKPIDDTGAWMHKEK